MEIEFDPEKAAANPANHDGVTFEEAKQVLLDPAMCSRTSLNHSIGANGVGVRIHGSMCLQRFLKRLARG